MIGEAVLERTGLSKPNNCRIPEVPLAPNTTMADASNTATVFENLQLNILHKDWVKTSWDQDFADFSTVPDETKEHLEERNYLLEQLKAVHDNIGTWLLHNNENDNGEGLWSILVECEISHKSLVVLLAYLCHNACKVSGRFCEKASGVVAASVYLRLISLPGSAAFKIYNPELFLQACRLLTMWNKTESGGKRKNKRSDVHTTVKSGAKKRKGHKKKAPSHEDLFEIGEDSDEELTVELTGAEENNLYNLKKLLLQDVATICEKYSLRQSESTVFQLLSILTSVCKQDPQSIEEEIGHWTSRNISTGMLAFKSIYLLCQPFHGHVTAAVNETFKLLLEHILMMVDGKLFSALGQPVVLMRRHALDFVEYVSKELGERCVSCLKALLKNMCFKVPDKTDYRTHGAEAVSELVDYLPDLEYAQMLEWFKRLSKHSKQVSHRSFAVDLMLTLIEKPERKLSGDVPLDIAEFSSHKSMVCTLLSRCSDSNAGIRSRALVGFSVCTSSKFRDVVSTIKDVLTPVAVPSRPAKHFMPTPVMAIVASETDSDADSVSNTNNNNCSEVSQGQMTENQVMDNEDGLRYEKTADTPQSGSKNLAICSLQFTPGFNPYLPDTEGVVSMFRRRILDTKVIVRKCAVQALQKVIELEAPSYRKEDLHVIQERCADPALSVRKQAVQSLFELLKAFPKDKNIQKSWIFGLLPQVMDRETSVQEKSFELLEEMILQHLKPAHRSTANGIEWDLLHIISDETCEKLRRYLQKACQYWARTKKLKSTMVSALLSHVNSENDKAAWMFLSEISKTPVRISHDVVIEHWKTVKTCEDEASCSKWFNVLTALASTIKHIPSHEQGSLLEDMKKRLRSFTYPPPIIAGMVNCVSKLHGCLERSKSQLQVWGEEIMRDCDNYMSQIILSEETSSTIDEDQLIRYMFTLGEVCQRCPTRMPKRVTLLIQSIIASPCLNAIGENIHQSTGASDGSHSSLGSQDAMNSPTKSVEGSQPSSQTSSQPLSQFRGSKMSNKLRAHAFITLGKLCLVDETLAEKTIAALARELEVSDSPAVRNNVVIVMGDLTIRYTTLVDRYVTNIAACLKDSSALVRKNTLTILTRLLQEEYVKWKGVLFFYYITTLLDETEEIKQLAEFCLEHLLLQKHPNLFFHPFIECIFHFNNYQNHPVYNKFKQTESEKKKFSLAGSSNLSSRMRLYTFMLEHMTDEQRFKITAKTNKEATIVDKIIPLDAEGSQLLIDALAILSCKEIKLSTMRNKGHEETDETVDLAQMVTATAKKVLITQVVKRNVMENIVPVVISLKHLLAKSRSPILKNLMEYLRELMKDYKTEIKDILAADRQLAEEIEFDLRNFESKQTEKETAAQLATPGNISKPNTPVLSREPSRPSSPLIRMNLTPPPQQTVAVLREHNVSPGIECPMELNSSRNASFCILDATKKAMTRVDQLRRSEINLKGAKKVNPAPGKISSKPLGKPALVQEQENENTKMSSFVRSSPLRAISTPTKDMNNVTFAQVGNMTMIPPSPIPSVASAISGGKLCLSPMIKVQQKGKKKIIHMPHPEAKDPEPAKWNIKSPNEKTKKSQEKNSGDTTPTRKSVTRSGAGMRRSVQLRK
ncbi:Condensin-2 complex subunit D3 [Bulinus truncatus]|nr:Condensin-2 complex subunit D3 [Bulinus truncatus]